MTLRKKLLSLALAGALTLSLVACSNSANTPTDTPAPSASPSADPTPTTSPESILPEDFVADTSAEDICLATTGIPGDFELFTVNGIPVSGYAYLYYLSNVITSFEENIIQTYGTILNWTSVPELVASVRESVLHSAALYTLLPGKAKEVGCDLTDEMRSELEATIALTMQYAGGEEAFFDELRKAGLDFDTFYYVNTAPYYLSQLQSKLAPDMPTDDELNTYIQENDLLRAKHILLMTVDSATRQPLDETTVAQKKATAEDILSQLQNSSDPIADFDKLMNEYSEDGGLIANPDGYIFTAGQMVAPFETGTRALEFNQISEIVESEFGYHIILRLDPATEELRAQCYESKAREALNTQLTAWVDEADIVLTPEYESFDLPMFYAKFNAYYEAFQAEAAAKAEEEAPAASSDTESESAD